MARRRQPHGVGAVDPLQRIVTVYRSLGDARVLTQDANIDGGDMVPGWKGPIADLFG